MAEKINYTEYDKETFVNPYNFVPIEFNKDSRENIDKLDSNRVTGYIACKIIARTPIAIPDTACSSEEKVKKEGNNKTFIHIHYPFMKNGNGDYAINGSSIRGMIRNVYETMTDSCFSTMSDDMILTTRNSSTNAYHPGFLIREEKGWCLYSAEKYPFKVKALYDKEREEKYIDINGKKLYSGDEVSFKTKYTKNGRKVVKEIKNDADSERGILVIGEYIRKKESEGVFVLKEKIIVDCEKVKNAMKGLEATYEIYNNSAINKCAEHYGYPAYKHMKKAGKIPIYYENKNGKLTLSFAAIGRISYEKTLNQLVNKKTPCKNRDNLCPACTLFGMVGNQALGSRVRFTEAKCTTPDKISEEVTLTELAQPRTSYMPFYSNVTKKDYGKKATPGYDDNGREIRGRKFYWHSGNFNELNSDVEKTERNSTVQIAESGTEFEFKVYFDSITKQELKKLIFVLNLGENTETGNLCHKIGHGKPVGLGSVKIFVSKIQTRQFDGEEYKIESYAEDYEEKPQDIDFESDTIKALLKICNLDSVHDVSYPYVVDKAGKQYKGTDNNDLASHKWFTENTSSKLGNRNRDVQFLPQINAPAQNLKPYQADTYAKEAVKYKIGSIYTGKVTGYNEKKTSARITLNNGGTASLFFRDLPNVRFGEIDKSLPKGKDVKVRYMGKEGKFEKWEKVNDEI